MPRRRRTYIREWRKYRDITLVRLSQRTGISQPSLSRIERGLQPYSQGILEVLADALSCEPADLIGRLPGAPNELQVLVNLVPPENAPALHERRERASHAALGLRTLRNPVDAFNVVGRQHHLLGQSCPPQTERNCSGTR